MKIVVANFETLAENNILYTLLNTSFQYLNALNLKFIFEERVRIKKFTLQNGSTKETKQKNCLIH